MRRRRISELPPGNRNEPNSVDDNGKGRDWRVPWDASVFIERASVFIEREIYAITDRLSRKRPVRCET